MREKGHHVTVSLTPWGERIKIIIVRKILKKSFAKFKYVLATYDRSEQTGTFRWTVNKKYVNDKRENFYFADDGSDKKNVFAVEFNIKTIEMIVSLK